MPDRRHGSRSPASRAARQKSSARWIDEHKGESTPEEAEAENVIDLNSRRNKKKGRQP